MKKKYFIILSLVCFISIFSAISSALTYYDNNTASMTNTLNNNGACTGLQFTYNGTSNKVLTEVFVPSGSTSTNWYVYSGFQMKSSNSVLGCLNNGGVPNRVAMGTLAGLVGNVTAVNSSIILTPGSNWTILIDGNGAGVTWKYGSITFPSAGSSGNITYVNCVSENAIENTYARALKGISFSDVASSSSFSTANFTSPVYSNNTHINVNYTYINVSTNANVSWCNLSWNGTNYGMVSVGTNQSWMYNVTNVLEGTYSYSVNCSDGTNNRGTGSRSLVFDFTNPIITWGNPNAQNTSSSVSGLTLNVNGSDAYLWSYGLNVTNSSGAQISYLNLTGISSTVYNLNQTISLPRAGLYNVKVCFADSHTATNFSDATLVKPSKLNSKIDYEFNQDNISIKLVETSNKKSLMDVSTTKLLDRYNFVWLFDTNHGVNSSYSFMVSTNLPIYKVENSKFKGHLVIGNKYWIDFENANVTINSVQVFNGYAIVNLSTADDLIAFNSLGGLNEICDSKTFQYGVMNLSNIIVGKVDGGVSSFGYNQNLANISAFVFNSYNGASNISVNATILYPDGSVALLNSPLTSISNSGSFTNGTWLLNTSLLLDRVGNYVVNISARDSLSVTNLTYVFSVSKSTTLTTGDGFFGWDAGNIPTSGELSALLGNEYNLIGLKINYSSFNSSWAGFKADVNQSFNANAKTFLRLNIQKANYSSYSSECSQIASNFTELKNYPYSDAVAFIVIDVNSSGVDNVSNYINQVSSCIMSATNNIIPIYTSWGTSGLNADYVSYWAMPRISESTNASFITAENNYLRNTTYLTRIYSGSSAEFKTLSKNYYDSVLTNIRARPTGTNQPTDSRLAELSNGDFVIFNNGSTANLNFNLNKTNFDVWDFSNKNFFKNIAGNITLNVNGSSASVLFADNYTRLVVESSGTSTLYKGYSNVFSSTSFATGGTGDASLTIYGAYDGRTELWSPDFGYTSLMFHSYEQLQYSQIADFSPYQIVVIAKGSNTPAIVNASLRVSEFPSILNKTYGYISVSDYNNEYANGTNISNCSIVNPWESSKIGEVDDWVSNYSANIFIDGFDIGFVNTPDCFNDRIKRVGDYVRYTKLKKSIFNTYTIYQSVANYGDAIMRESCFSRWSGDVSSPTYSYEDMALMVSHASFTSTNNKPVICMAFGEVNDYDKMMYDFYAFNVLYGAQTGNGDNNTFRYAQPNFQVQREIRVPNFGSMMQNTFDSSDSNDWTRRYSGGVVHVSPYRNYTFPNGEYYWFDDGSTVSGLTFSGIFQIYGSTCESSQDVRMLIGNTTRIVDSCNDVGFAQWTATRVTKDFTGEHSDNGHYYVTLMSDNRAEAVGMTVWSRSNTQTGVHSWYDNTAFNPPSTEAQWTAYGRSGTIGDANTTNLNFNISLNKTYSQSVDDSVNVVSQTLSFSGSGLKSGIMNLSSSKDINLSTLSAVFSVVSSRNVLLNWSGTNLNFTDGNIDCLSLNPSLSYLTVAGESIGACRYINGTNVSFRVLVPHLSEWDIVLNEANYLPVAFTRVVPSLAYKNSSFAGYCNSSDADGDNVSFNYTWYVNGVNVSNGTSAFYVPGTEIYVGNISGSFVHFDNVTLSCTGYDGLEYGVANTSNAVMISNSVPVTVAPIFSPTSANVLTQNLSCLNSTTSDADSDSISFNYSWYKNGTNISTSQIITNASYSRGDVLICMITAFDGFNYSSSMNSSLVVGSVPPVVVSSRIIPNTSINVDDVLIGYCNATDYENENLSYVYKWYRDGVLALTGSSVASVPGVELNVRNLSGVFSGGETWSMGCIANDSSELSVEVLSNNVSIILPVVIGGSGGSQTFSNVNKNFSSRVSKNSYVVNSRGESELVFDVYHYLNGELYNSSLRSYNILSPSGAVLVHGQLDKISEGVYRFVYDFEGYESGVYHVQLLTTGSLYGVDVRVVNVPESLGTLQSFIAPKGGNVDALRVTVLVVSIFVVVFVFVAFISYMRGKGKKARKRNI